MRWVAIYAPGSLQHFKILNFEHLCRYWDLRQQTPVHTQQLPERCYAMSVRYPLMVVATADRNIVVYNLQSPQVSTSVSAWF